jgi:exopolyphosphatase/guanosine-5'-triphosphate,3'-diphosphate pyrophosphatase
MATLPLMKKNIAIIDLGSNLTKLVVVANKLPLEVIHRSVYDTKTLKSAPKGYFDSVSIERIENDISKILTVAKVLDCETHLGIATSAFRTRNNGKEVIANLNAKFGINIQIIEGEREANLIYKGALASVTPSEFPVLIMDIGGGSTEFIIGTEKKILWKHSFDFGSTALTKDSTVSDPLLSAEIVNLESKLTQVLTPLFDEIKKHNPGNLIGTTGAFESLAQITENKKGNTTPVNSGYVYSESELDTVIKKLMTSNTKERELMDGMNPLRIGTINIAALIFNYVSSKTKFNTKYLSLGDVKEGLALEYLKTNS